MLAENIFHVTYTHTNDTGGQSRHCMHLAIIFTITNTPSHNTQTLTNTPRVEEPKEWIIYYIFKIISCCGHVTKYGFASWVSLISQGCCLHEVDIQPPTYPLTHTLSTRAQTPVSKHKVHQLEAEGLINEVWQN